MGETALEKRTRLWRAWAPRLAALLLGTLVPPLLLEGALRLLPVRSSMSAATVNAEAPVFHFEPRRSFVYSKNWNFRMVNRGEINNVGYVAGIDYVRDRTVPLVGIVGDSYVEAVMVPWRQTLSGRLAEELDARASVYGFAASGAPLSQYLVWAQQATEVYGATALVHVVVGNDFDESLLSYKLGSGFHYFDDRSSEPWPLVRVDFEADVARRIVRRSALARYLLLNLDARLALPRLRDRLTGRVGTSASVGNTAAAATQERIDRSETAVRRFLDLLPAMTGLAPDRILFLVDGIRPELYSAAGEPAPGSYYALMRQAFLGEASTRGYTAVDMQPLFISEHRRTGARFEFEIDAHWNAAGHRQAACVALPWIERLLAKTAP